MKRDLRVPLTNGVIAAGLVAVLALVALVAKPPAPPGIAEFAPQATKPITKAPPGQASKLGSGPSGQCLTNSGGCSPIATPAAMPSGRPQARPTGSAVPSSLQCYLWPDGSVTQTFDPQSPPCIAAWDDAARGNGGATATGVSGTEIRVGIPGQVASNNQITGVLQQALVSFFNTHFQLYGRKISLVHYSDAAGGSAEALHADAKAAKQSKLFASLDYDAGDNDTGDQTPWVTDLANQHIVSVTGMARFLTTDDYASLTPYAWTLQPPWDQTRHAIAAVVCRQLKGHPAAHSREFSGTTRTFGLLLPSAAAMGGSPHGSLRPLVDELRACGVDVEVAEAGAGGCTSTSTAGKQQMADWKTKGITTIIWITARSLGSGEPICNATAVDYTPEWLVSGTGAWAQYPFLWTSQPPNQRDGLMTLMPGNPLLALTREPFSQALQATGRRADTTASGTRVFYQELQAIASGIQLAGPQLTATTFASGLRSTSFPNPGRGLEPYFQAGITRTGTGGFYGDFALGWWSQTAEQRDKQYGAKGAFCFVRRASRWTAEDIPAGDPGYFDTRSSLCL